MTSTVRRAFWWKYHNSDMELRLRSCSALAEGILHRLFRAYFARDREIPADQGALAFVCNVPIDDVRDVWPELQSVIDLTGPSVVIPWLDETRRQVEAVSQARQQAGLKGAAKRWGTDGGSPDASF